LIAASNRQGLSPGVCIAPGQSGLAIDRTKAIVPCDDPFSTRQYLRLLCGMVCCLRTSG
jgi:hypothetical protein